jgi:hypothetical protein
MYAMICCPGGIIVEAVILSRTRDRMRVVAAGLSDALDLRRSGRDWSMDTGEPVQFEFLAAASPVAREAASPAAIVRSAGSA